MSNGYSFYSEIYQPYHIQKVQALQFCQEMLRRSRQNLNFSTRSCGQMESHFQRSGVFNIHNYHSWARVNPHQVRASNFQHQFGVNLWTGELNRQLIGPFELPNNGALCHYAVAVREHLNDNYPNKWIDRGSPIRWPPLSSDLNSDCRQT